MSQRDSNSFEFCLGFVFGMFSAVAPQKFSHYFAPPFGSKTVHVFHPHRHPHIQVEICSDLQEAKHHRKLINGGCQVCKGGFCSKFGSVPSENIIYSTLPKTSSKSPENEPSRKEASLPTIHFQVQTVSFREGSSQYFLGCNVQIFQ